MAPVTVRNVLRLALPPGTTVVAGTSGLNNQVTWVASQRATPPVFANLRGGELALVSVAGVQAMDEQINLATLIAQVVAGADCSYQRAWPDRRRCVGCC